jgi:hypothetical protein
MNSKALLHALRGLSLGALVGTVTGLVACGSGGGSGNGGGAGDGGVVVTSNFWSPPPVIALVETDNTGRAEDAQVAVDASGNALAVWIQWDGQRDNVWANRYIAGTGWGTALLIETDNTGRALHPHIAVDSKGNAMAVWAQSTGAGAGVWANRYASGTGWGTAVRIETDSRNSSNRPIVAFDASGNAAVVWDKSDGPLGSSIWANRYTIGTGWGTAVLVETEAVYSAYSPQIAFDASGNALAVWQQWGGKHFDIWANRYAAGSGWGTAVLIEADDAGDAYFPQVAVDSSGNALAVWQQSDGTRPRIWSNRYAAGKGWSTATRLDSGNPGAGSRPQIAFDAKGNALAVWSYGDATLANIFTSRYTAGAGWSTAAPIGGNTTDAMLYPKVAFDAAGNAVAVWSQSVDTVNGIWANRYTAGTGWGTSAQVATESTSDAFTLQMAVDASGNAMAVWPQSDGTRENVWSARFK